MINGLAIIRWSHFYELGSVNFFTIIFCAGPTFSFQRIGTVSVLAVCLLFVSIFALTNREKYNVTNVYGSIDVHKRRTDGDH